MPGLAGASVANHVAKDANKDLEFAFLANWESTKNVLVATCTMFEPATSDLVHSLVFGANGALAVNHAAAVLAVETERVWATAHVAKTLPKRKTAQTLAHISRIGHNGVPAHKTVHNGVDLPYAKKHV